MPAPVSCHCRLHDGGRAPLAAAKRRLRAWPLAGALALCLASGGAAAESLRCTGGIAAVGDSRLSLLAKCGPPQLSDSYCAAVFQGPNPNPVPELIARQVVPCLVQEDMLYDRGPGNLVATVRVRSGMVQSIQYGKQPR